jgi:hypothetical protein
VRSFPFRRNTPQGILLVLFIHASVPFLPGMAVNPPSMLRLVPVTKDARVGIDELWQVDGHWVLLSFT